MTEPTAVETLASRLGASWPAITGARARAGQELAELATILNDLSTPDAAVIVYGSLARGETTSQSDLDWTLLVDGPAKPEQMTCVRQIRAALERKGRKPPSPGGAFGSMSFSHELVHRIGGDADTNRITTQRVLLLLESTPIRDAHGYHEIVHDRAMRSVLGSYLEAGDGGSKKKLPRFLLNDVVRYWRTIAVDFAAKAREQGDTKWAIRRLKLQTSRKLIFAAGLVMALTSYVDHPDGTDREALLDVLVKATRKTPLDLIAQAALDHDMILLARGIFDAYDAFLALLDDETKRTRLEAIPRDEASEDAVFKEAHEIGNRFGNEIEAFFFDGKYKAAIRTYGVF